MQVEFSSFVEADLEAIADAIAEENPDRAVSFLREFRKKLIMLARNPMIYQLRPDIGEGARLAVLGRNVILFRILNETVIIERVVYGGRDLPPLFLE